MFHLFQQVTTYKPLVPRLFQEQGTKTGTFQEHHWNTQNTPLNSRNVWNMFQGDYFSSRESERNTLMATRNPNPIRVRAHHAPTPWTTTALEVATVRIPKGGRTVRRYQLVDKDNRVIYELQPAKAIELINALADELEKS